MRMRTQVGIVGAGPAGLMLAQRLHLHGIDSVVVERRSRTHVVERVRAGVLEPGTVQAFAVAGVGRRLAQQGLRRSGVHFSFAGYRHRLDLLELAGHSITIYGQNEVLKDLIDARIESGRFLCFEAEDVQILDLDSASPLLCFRDPKSGQETVEVACDFIAGCDGFQGVSRASIPAAALTTYTRTFPFSWLGILAKTVPALQEPVYGYHEHGFALYNQRSQSLIRAHLQCSPGDVVADWPDTRIEAELGLRLADGSGFRPRTGEILQKAMVPMRAFGVEPMRYGRLFLAGDSAHVFPASGAKGLNAAVADASRLADALHQFYSAGDTFAIDRYSEIGLASAWRVQELASWMTHLLHRFDPADGFEHRTRLVALEHLVTCPEASRSFARRYLGLPPLRDGESPPARADQDMHSR